MAEPIGANRQPAFFSPGCYTHGHGAPKTGGGQFRRPVRVLLLSSQISRYDAAMIRSFTLAVAALLVLGPVPGLAAGNDGDFASIVQFTNFGTTLPDGKHPVWVYYIGQGSKPIIRVDMPSLDMCVVTEQSRADHDLLESRHYDVVRRGSRDWNMAHEIWDTAFRRHMLVGAPKAC